jgi:WD40 repeat protein
MVYSKSHVYRLTGVRMVWGACASLLFINAAVFGAAPAAQPEQPGYPPAIRCVDFSPDGRLLASAASDQTKRGVLVVWEVQTLKPRFAHRESVGFPCLKFSPDGRILALARFAPEAALFEVETGKLMRKLEGHSNHARCVAFTPDGEKLITGSYDRTIKIWDLSTDKVEATLEGHADAVYHVEVSADGRLLASADARTDTVRLWELATHEQVHAFENLGSLVPHVTFSPDGRLLAVASWAGHLTLFDTGSYEPWLRLRYLGGFHWSAFSPDRHWLAVATNSPAVYVFDMRAEADVKTQAKILSLLAQLTVDSYEVREQATEALAEIGMAAEPKLRESLQSDSPEVRWRARRLRDWLSNPDAAIKLEGHQGELNSVCFSPDGRLLASGDDTGQVRLWHVGTWNSAGQMFIGAKPVTQKLQDWLPLAASTDD